ncbi:MAG: gamma carbonic anhydrase family protein [Candidatus Melainabacteria bacterium]|nr:gamma carbonic anhydrase family protein [Candidatus Melainabacteria bacterium]
MLYTYLSFSPQIDSSVYIAPTATIIGRATIGTESSVWFNTIVRADINTIEIGSQTNIQDSCVLHVTNQFKVKIKDRVTIGHGAILHGCTVESDCLIAMGAIILDGAIIKSGSMVAAGSVVAPGTVIPPQSLVMGTPGKVVRTLNDDDKARMKRNWQNYIGYARTYLDPKSVQSV